jgi:hypothetical protein
MVPADGIMINDACAAAVTSLNSLRDSRPQVKSAPLRAIRSPSYVPSMKTLAEKLVVPSSIVMARITPPSPFTTLPTFMGPC